MYSGEVPLSPLSLPTCFGSRHQHPDDNVGDECLWTDQDQLWLDFSPSCWNGKPIRVSTCLCHFHLVCICKPASPMAPRLYRAREPIGRPRANGRAGAVWPRPFRHVALGEATRAEHWLWPLPRRSHAARPAHQLPSGPTVLPDSPPNKGRGNDQPPHPEDGRRPPTSSATTTRWQNRSGYVWKDACC